MTDNISITRDPIYYFTVGFFALLTTALPALMGQPRFLPIIQTLALTIFVAVAIHRHNVLGAIKVMALWLPIQFVVLTLLTVTFGQRLEAAFANGFLYRGAITAWFFAGTLFPAGLVSEPLTYVIEVIGILLGSLATAGLVGTWFLVRLVNQAAYGTGILLAALEDPGQSFLVLPYWTLLRAAGYASLIVLCAEPLLTNTWSPSYYWQQHRRLLLISVTLVLLGLLLELFLPGIVARTPTA
jgi:hypothetical protein